MNRYSNIRAKRCWYPELLRNIIRLCQYTTKNSLFPSILYCTDENFIMALPMQDIDNFVKYRIVDGDGICVVVIYHSTANTAITIIFQLPISAKDIHTKNVLVRLSVIFKNMRIILTIFWLQVRFAL
jgi:hypothetical protein